MILSFEKRFFMKKEGVNYLGIDWGESKIGLALAHAETRIALAYAVVPNDASLIKRLEIIIKAESIGTVVIGIPSYRERGQAVSKGEVLGDTLKARMPIQVEFFDEMFTSKLAQQNLIESGKKAVTQKDDSEAARIILQEWLDTFGA